MSIKILNAVKNSLYSQLAIYLKHGYNFKVKTEDLGYNVLMVALTIPDPEKRLKMFKFLLNLDCIHILDVDNKDRNIFFWVVIKQCIRELDILMQDYHTEIDWTYLDSDGRTILHHGVLTNNLTIMSILLKYCAKYKINVDIPDAKEKITPYLLACRLNYNEIADLLQNLGGASKNQFDESNHLTAEQWKAEGKIEKVGMYLEAKRLEMKNAKLSGKIKKYNDLKDLSQTIDLEMHKNPNILPILANAIANHENHDKDEFNYSDSSNYFKRTNIKNIQSKEVVQNSYKTTADFNKVLKNTMNSLKEQNKGSQVNSLLDEMTNGEIVEHFVGSKSDNDSEINSIKFENSVDYTNIPDKIAFGFSENKTLIDISDMFNVLASQQTKNFRIPAKFILKPKEKPKKKQKVKTGLSTLAIIREESRISGQSKKPIKYKLNQPKKGSSFPNLKFKELKQY